MKVDDLARNARLQESLESVHQAKRRDQALFRSPVKAPENFPNKESRRLYAEAREEFLRRG
jgi:hypothetical protein